MRRPLLAAAGHARSRAATILAALMLAATAWSGGGAAALDLPGISADAERLERQIVEKAPPQPNPATQAAAVSGELTRRMCRARAASSDCVCRLNQAPSSAAI
ncbi:MAG: hypothetical protein ACK4QW_17550 [Alphaproteobacteria bacterium]